MDKKEFALQQLKEYALDLSKCGFDGKSCMNITPSGKMCVAGKNYLPKIREEFPSAGFLSIKDKYNNQNEFLIPESVDILSTQEWITMQAIHDYIARGVADEVEFHVKKLNLFTLEELYSQ